VLLGRIVEGEGDLLTSSDGFENGSATSVLKPTSATTRRSIGRSLHISLYILYRLELVSCGLIGKESSPAKAYPL